MLRFVGTRLLVLLPTLIVVSLFTFGLKQCSPVDPVRMALEDESTYYLANRQSPARERAAYRRVASRLSEDLPLFYFSIHPVSFPDTLHRLLPRDHRRAARRLVLTTGDWPVVADFYQQLDDWQDALHAIPDSLQSRPPYRKWRELAARWQEERDFNLLQQQWTAGPGSRPSAHLAPAIAASHSTMAASVAALKTTRPHWTDGLPTIHWHGTHNQYHHWLSHFLAGDWGISTRDGRPVREVIGQALRWTLLLNGIALLLAYLIAVPLGVTLAGRNKSDRWVSRLLFLLYSLPVFWVGTMMLIFLTNPRYGMDWFPALWMGHLPEDIGSWKRLLTYAHHLVLPVICLTYGALAFLYRQTRRSMNAVLARPYITVARAKGVGGRRLRWYHAFRNALFPLITLLANVFPALLAGSFVVEEIFNVPGMGRLTVHAIRQNNFPVVYSVVMIGAVMTILGLLVADVLYRWADPRVDQQR